MANFRDSRRFAATIDAAAEQLGLSAAIVEKDYWVTQALRLLASDHSADFIFKGGTSLSKGYFLIERFSEDIDILVHPRPTKSATHTLMKQMANGVESVLGGPSTVESSETGIHRNVRVQYPAAHSGQGIAPAVLLEAGIRGGSQPSERLPVGCLLGDTLHQGGVDIEKFGDLQHFDVEMLHPGRTLLEKLALLHSAFGGDFSNQQASKHTRHYYDVYQLLGDERVLTVLGDRAEFTQILQSMSEVNNKWYGGGEFRPATRWADSPAFDTTRPDYGCLQHAYATAMGELYLGSGSPPSLDVVCARVAEYADLL